MGTRLFYPGHKEWPDDAFDLTPDKIIKLYKDGFAGCWRDDEAREKRREETKAAGEPVFASEACAQAGIIGLGANKLCLPFIGTLLTYAGCWPGAAQQRGDCVSHSTKNAALTTFCRDIQESLIGKPDEVTGLREVAPEIPLAGILQGAFSSEYEYWWRGYNGDGWDCDTAAGVVVKHGVLLRKPYPELGIDLTTYSGSLAGKYGSRPPTDAIAAEGALHPIRTSTEIDWWDQQCDLTASGYGISTCGGEGFSDERDENGVSRRQGSWSHAYACIGTDNRQEIIDKYGEPLELNLNSWARWNRGGRDIYMSAALVPPELKERWIKAGIVNPSTGNIMIPEGAWWNRKSESSRRYKCAFSGAAGWTAPKIDFSWL